MSTRHGLEGHWGVPCRDPSQELPTHRLAEPLSFLVDALTTSQEQLSILSNPCHKQ